MSSKKHKKHMLRTKPLTHTGKPLKRQEKAERIGVILDKLYPTQPIPLDHKDAYTLLIAVLLSAQCTDARVNLVTPKLFELASTPEHMTQLSIATIQNAIASCGLAPTKAKNIHNLSQMLVHDHEGEVPNSLDALERLPGVGHKTASVVMSQWFGEPMFPVDTHIHRLATRWGLTRGKNVVHTERDLKRAFPRKEWNRRHLQIIFFGREHCPARGHDLTQCMICGWAATKKQIAQEIRSSQR